VRVAVPLPIRVAHAEIFSETALEAAGADTVLVISTAAPDHALLVRTVYVVIALWESQRGGRDGGDRGASERVGRALMGRAVPRQRPIGRQAPLRAHP
jgi:hypothetical protein